MPNDNQGKLFPYLAGRAKPAIYKSKVLVQQNENCYREGAAIRDTHKVAH
jgi:hypothetical protein